MKLIINIATAFFITTIGFAQVPSINFNSKNRAYTKLDLITKKENKLAKEIKKLESLDSLELKIKKDKGNDIVSKKIELKNIQGQKEEARKLDQDYIYNTNYYSKKISEIEKKIKKLDDDLIDISKVDDNRDRINQYESEKIELEKTKENTIVERDRKLNPINNNYSWILPTLNPKYRNAFFEDIYRNSTSKTNFINALSLSGGKNEIIAQSELIADNFKMCRITFGTVIAKSNDSLTNDKTQVEALQRLIAGGGNVYTDLTLPLATTIKGNNDDLINAYLYANLKAAADLKGFGNDIDTTTYNSSLGMNFYGDLSSENRKFNFFCAANANYYCFSTKEFYSNIGIDHNHGFLFSRITVGVTLLNQFRFSANVATFSSEPSLRKEKITVGIQFLSKN